MVKTRNMVQIDGEVYAEAKRLAAEKGITVGAAVVEVGENQGPSLPACTEAGFRAELRDMGLTAPPKVNWLFGVLDRLPLEMVEGSKLEPYAKAKAVAELNCEIRAESLRKLMAAQDLPTLNELAGAAADGSSQDVAEDVPEVPVPQESGG